MTLIGVDDTDSRELGMCTTYVAARLAERVREHGGHVERTLLVRLNPAVEHKTRGNAALAVHCDLPPDEALELAADALDRAATADPRTNPGAVVADARPETVPDAVADVARRAVREHVDLNDVRDVLETAGFETAERGMGRGLIGATAAVGAWAAFDEWTYECISYRERDRWGTDRDVDYDSLFAAADDGYPDVWDTVDRDEGAAVCVPRTPCPILHGIRGDDPDAVRAVAERIESEPVARRHTFVTNQGTDAHLRDGTIGDLQEGRAYRVTGTVASAPETREGGHVFVSLEGDGGELRCAAFEPTKRFRDRVRTLRVGDRVTVCGEVGDGTLKLEKFAVRDLVRTERVTPDCPDCGRSMKSAGANAGYRCRDCGTSADGKVERETEREIEEGWYEVPPVARRHIAKPLVRGGFDAPTHPEQ
ncbi:MULTISPECIES: tRNA(Ile)(2)-agmatinylcytidine synthase [Salinibaculum]|uniref:tRNA(Ile)(2)-agmatinylcytidine synthase n=1 Tax=Salinibaculum TaxID=2732368 RepID=UPI0030CA9C35